MKINKKKLHKSIKVQVKKELTRSEKAKLTKEKIKAEEAEGLYRSKKYKKLTNLVDENGKVKSITNKTTILDKDGNKNTEVIKVITELYNLSPFEIEKVIAKWNAEKKRKKRKKRMNVRTLLSRLTSNSDKLEKFLDNMGVSSDELLKNVQLIDPNLTIQDLENNVDQSVYKIDVDFLDVPTTDGRLITIDFYWDYQNGSGYKIEVEEANYEA